VRTGYLLILGLVSVVLALTASSAFGRVPANALEGPIAPAGGSDGGTPLFGEDSLEAGQFQRIPGHYIVVFNDSVDHPGALAEEQVEQRDGELGLVYRSAIEGYSAELSAAAVKALRSDPRVKYVMPDGKAEGMAQSTPTGISRIFATANAGLDIDGVDDVRVDVDVAIIDSGTDPTHPDLNVVSRTNCIPLDENSEGGTCVDNSGVSGEHMHGTHTGGTVGAIDNGIGVVGVAPGARLWSVRVLGKQNFGWWSWVIAGVDWVTAHSSEIEVVNMSVASYGPVPALEEAISASVEEGVVYVVAAGNEGLNTATIAPSSNPDVISVSGLADYDGKPGGLGSPTCADRGADDSSYVDSDWGSPVDIVAPGVCINSTIPGGGYLEAWGTSMAAPHVAGAAAVLASKSNPNTKADVEAIRQALIDGGTLDWTDSSEDAKVEPVLNIDDQPVTKTEAATGGWESDNVKSTTLYGAINARGLETTYQFEYGTTTSYGQSTPASPKTLGAGTYYTTVSESVGGLVWGQTYHYRLVATNSSGKAYGQDQTFVATRWARQVPKEGPSNPEIEWLEDVSCKSSECVSVGANVGSGAKHGITYRLVGGEWKFESLPVPSGGYGDHAFGVSCSSGNACTAVGAYTASSEFVVPLVARWNGSSWTSQPVPSPYSGAPYTQLTDVSCRTASECMAVGYYYNTEGKYVNYAARWSGGAWTNVLPPNPAGAQQSLLEGVSCPSAGMCVAVGWQISAEGAAKPVIVAWNGFSWSSQTAARSSGTISAVSCPSTTYCAAAGSSGLSLEAWNGSSWSSQTVAAPPRGGGFSDVSCSNSSHCAAVGSGWKYNGYAALIEVWNGSSWETQTAPRDPEAATLLRGVACSGISGCTTVGDDFEKSRKSVIMQRADVVTTSASSISPTQATLNGKIVPGGLSTDYYFEYGTSQAYGAKAPVSSASAGSGIPAVSVSQAIGELLPATTYHYRLVGSNASGTSFGEDMTFTTTAPTYAFKSSFGTSGTGNGQLARPLGLAVDKNGELWVADSNNNRIQRFNAKGEYMFKFGSSGSADGQLNTPTDIAIDGEGNLWVTDSGNDRLQKFSPEGKFLAKFGSSGAEPGKFLYPARLAIAPNGHIWVSDDGYYRVEEFTAGGEFVRQVTGFVRPSGVEVDAEGHVWVVDRGDTEDGNHEVVELSATGEVLGKFGSFGDGDGEFETPTVMAIEPSGNLLVPDRWTGRVQRFTPAGAYLAQFGGEQLNEPEGIAVAPDDVVYVSNSWSNKIEKWQLPIPKAVSGEASAVSSNGATLAGVVNPRGVATTYRFEYGETTAYGSKAPVPNASAGSGTTDVAVSKEVGGLSPNTTYHFRVVATSAEGTTFGNDGTFTTKSAVTAKLNGMAVTDPFNGSTSAVSNFGTDWSALGWAAGSPAKGENSATGWRPVSTFPTVSGAFYGSTVTDTGTGTAVAATMATNPGNAERYFSLWLDLTTPATTRAGYELRFTNVSTNTYNVSLSKWQGGSQTVLTSKSGYSFVNGNSFALADEGGTVSAWTNTGSGFDQLLSASDTTFSSGNSAVEGAGSATKLTNFKVGSLLTPVAGMDAALKGLAMTDSFGTNETPLSGGGAWGALFWDNSSSGHNTGRVSGGWGPFDAYATVNGAYWTKATSPDTGAGIGAAALLFARPGGTSRYFSLWLDMPSPASAKTGYELRFTETASNVYEVTLAKWQAGSKTTLGTKTGYSFAVNSLFGLVDKGGTVSAWTKTGSEYTQLLSASDSAFKTGYAGIEGAGNITRLKDFRSGPLAPF